MKKIVLTIMAVAAMAACSKSGVEYETSGEIGFAPAVKNITKAAMEGVYPETLRLGVYANYGSVDPTKTLDPNKFTTGFLADAVFTHKTVGTVKAWGGGYSWPNNGSLIFAGYSLPQTGTVGTERSYDFKTDILTIKGYTQSTNTAETFDLAWFGRTSESYNYRNQEDAVDVTLSHALAWVEIRAYGEGTTVTEGNPWTITSIVMNNVANMGNVSCQGSGAGNATWNTVTGSNDITIFTGSKPLTINPETVYETIPGGTLVIPQNPSAVNTKEPEKEIATLTVKYTYKSPTGADMPEQTTTVSLSVTDGWKSGYKYIYTLKFKANEILVAPSYNTWADGGNKNVIVE